MVQLGKYLLWFICGTILVYLSILLVFRWVPIPTSAFIHHQNALHNAEPKVYAAANYQWVDWEDIPPALALAVVIIATDTGITTFTVGTDVVFCG